ncbi:MAG: NAD(P)H-dependent oxidoreductase [Ramlibacter sp.]|nr:NAD(P)H-dependent oxidoreductase [Ramlibacter sp.]
MQAPRHFLFLVASTRQSPEDGGHLGNTEWLAQQAAAALPAGTRQTWHALARMALPPFVDQRHTTGQYPLPTGDLKTLLDATMAATDIVLVSPVYWYSLPAPLKTYIDHWSAWMRVPGLPFKDEMARKSLRLITTSGDRAKAQPMIDSVTLCAQFLSMAWGGALWGKGGPPDAVQADTGARQQAATFLIADNAH